MAVRRMMFGGAIPSWQARVSALTCRFRVKQQMDRMTDPQQMRDNFPAVMTQPPAGVTRRDATVGGIKGEWSEPANPSAPVLLYLHGGGYISGSPLTHRTVTAAFATHGFRVFAPDYRLAPEHPYPAALQDARRCYAALSAKGPVAIAGESAGGGLALALMVALRNGHATLPTGAALFSPWTDLTLSGASITRNAHADAMLTPGGLERCAPLYFGAADPAGEYVSPLFADLAGLPPLLIHVGESELLLDDSARLADRARAAGVAVTYRAFRIVPHGWQLIIPFMPEARQSVAEAAAHLHAVSAAPVAA